MGRILETAAILNKPVCLYVTSDGSVVSNDSATDRQTPWVSDRGSTGVAYMIIFQPGGVVRPLVFKWALSPTDKWRMMPVPLATVLS